MQNKADTSTQNSQLYIGTPNGIVLCADEGSGHELKGRFYHAYSEDAVHFENADQLIFEMEKFFDSIHFPHPGTRIRSFAESSSAGKEDFVYYGKRERIMKDQELLSKHGDLGSFIIRVKQRQNSSMQGRLTWVEKNKTVRFRSVWEMIRLIDSAVEMDNPVPEEELPSWED